MIALTTVKRYSLIAAVCLLALTNAIEVSATATQFPDNREDSPACKDARGLQAKNYQTLTELNATPCPAGREASCQALKATLIKINQDLTTKIVSACLPPWMFHAAGLDKPPAHPGS